ncbi:hypothetical protein [Actinomadura atramentaria]|uniref:hypothetical protein n=1 Tax=Actinomadura atramentaria TaxID=1990 RepID=UPI00037B557A|nr:hypothetical protein [Actinomadura atramentaria]
MEIETCPSCPRRAAASDVESAHLTSEGVVRYRRCVCGARWIDLRAFRWPAALGPAPR